MNWRVFFFVSLLLLLVGCGDYELQQGVEADVNAAVDEEFTLWYDSLDVEKQQDTKILIFYDMYLDFLEAYLDQMDAYEAEIGAGGHLKMEDELVNFEKSLLSFRGDMREEMVHLS
jgi:hypothetical protein